MKIDDKYAFWRWPRIIREQHAHIDRDAKAIGELRTAIRDNADRHRSAQALCQEFQEVARDSKAQLAILTDAHMRTAGQHEAAQIELERLRSHLEIAQNEMVRTELDKSRSELELAKARVIIEQLKMDLDKEKRAIAERDHKFKIVSDWIVATHRLKVAPVGQGIRDLLQKAAKVIVFLFALFPLICAAQQPPPLLRGPFTTNTPAWSQTNVVSLSISNGTSKPLTNHYQDGVLTLFGLEGAGSVTLSVNGTNILITGTAGGSSFQTNANQFGQQVILTIKAGAFQTNMNFWLSGTNNGDLWIGGDVTPLSANTFRIGTTGLPWLSGAFGGDGVSLVEPVSGLFTTLLPNSGILASYNITFPDNQGADGQILTNNGAGTLGWWTPVTSGGSGLTTNANQFGASVQLTIKSGALLTNATIWQSNALLPALIATNQPGGTVDLVTMLTTNAAGLRVTSNGAVVVHGVIGSTTNSFEVRRSNNAAAIFGVTHSNTVRIVGPNQTGYGATLVIQSESGSSQNNIELWTGDTISGRWRSDNTGNQIISAEGGGEIQFNYDGVANGRVAFGLPGVGNIWHLVPSASVAAFHGGTARRGQITNVWDVFCRSNVAWIEVGGSDVVSLQSTSGMSSYTMFLPITNALAGQVLYMPVPGQLAWKDDANTGGALFNPNQFLPSATHTNIKDGALLTNISHFGIFTVDGDILPLTADTRSIGSLSVPFSQLFSRNGYLMLETGGGVDSILLEAPSALAAPYNLTFPTVQGADGQVLTNDGAGALGWWTPVSSGGGLVTNGNQFGAQTTLTIKSGALLTNALFYPSNLTAPAAIHLATTAQVTNVTEWRNTNGEIRLAISSNANAIVYGRLDMSNAVAFRTNNVDFRLPVYQAFTNALQTNLVLQLTNSFEGVTHRVDCYGAGRLGNGRTNAWQLLCTVAANNFIYWPPGTTNGNFDVLVNSNQIVSFTFMGGLGSSNIMATYRVLEGIGVN